MLEPCRASCAKSPNQQAGSPSLIQEDGNDAQTQSGRNYCQTLAPPIDELESMPERNLLRNEPLFSFGQMDELVVAVKCQDPAIERQPEDADRKNGPNRNVRNETHRCHVLLGTGRCNPRAMPVASYVCPNCWTDRRTSRASETAAQSTSTANGSPM